MAQQVLIVDDEPQIQRFLGPALNAAGYDVPKAENGRDALRMIAVSAPDIVELDPGLPDMDGKKVCAKKGAFTMGQLSFFRRATARRKKSPHSISARTIMSRSLSPLANFSHGSTPLCGARPAAQRDE